MLPHAFDVEVVLGNLPIPNPAFGSADASEDQKDGLARLRSGFLCTCQIAMPSHNRVLGNRDGRHSQPEYCQCSQASAGVSCVCVQHGNEILVKGGTNVTIGSELSGKSFGRWATIRRETQTSSLISSEAGDSLEVRSSRAPRNLPKTPRRPLKSNTR